MTEPRYPAWFCILAWTVLSGTFYALIFLGLSAAF